MRYTVYGKLAAWVIFLCLYVPSAYAQLSLSQPANRTVLQRDKNNSATVYIRGTYEKVIDRVEVQLRAINGGNNSGWMTIQDNPQGGSYAGQVDWTGGWYEMEVRGWLGGQLVGSTTLPRLGIGEVFMIAGQSNSQGYLNYGAQGAGDDRVNCINYYNTSSASELPQPAFEHLDANSYIAPRGNSAWGYGRLGDVLASRLGVPILFYNMGWYGSAMRNWRESINGPAFSVYNGEPYLPAGQPYGNLRLVLRHYIPITGVRAILWHQGESDNFANTGSNSYKNDLKQVITQSRNEAGFDLSWVVARASYDNQRGVDVAVTNAQSAAVAESSNAFYGPETDRIQIPRMDGVHFQNDGLRQFGEAWANALNDDFFARSTPHKATPYPKINIACAGNGQVRLSVDGDYSSINWSNGQSGRDINVGGGGRYKATVRDGAGRILYSPEIVISGQIQPPTPTINIEGGRNRICQGSSLSLSVEGGDNVRWNTGQTERQITISDPNTFSVTTRSVYGCEATSAAVTIGVFDTPPPPKPSITVEGTTEFCAGGVIKLKSNANTGNIWSTGQDGSEINVDNSGDYRVRAVDGNGCTSPESEPVSIRVNPLPSRPAISASGNTTFCADQSVTLTSSYGSGNVWNTETGTQSIVVTKSGQYSVSVKDDKGCVSTSAPVDVNVNPLPDAPTIKSLRPTTFCDRDLTTLESSPSAAYSWSNGSQERQVDIRTSGEYSLSAIDENGCRSAAAAPVRVTVNPLPPQPTITASGSTTFCADKSVMLTASVAEAYVWSNGTSKKETTVSQEGSYQVQVKNKFGCISDPSDRVNVETLPLPPAPVVTATGRTTFCEGEQVKLTASGNGTFQWNTGISGPSIMVGESGNYSAQVLGGNGCYSAFSSIIRLVAKPNPAVPVISQVGTYTLEALKDQPDERLLWQRNGEALDDTTSIIKAGQRGTYLAKAFITYSPTLTCASEFSPAFAFVPEAGGSGISIYPNPTDNGLLMVETLENLKNATILIYDLKGVVVKTFEVPLFNERKRVDLSTLPGGMYIIKITTGPFNATQKLMIAR